MTTEQYMVLAAIAFAVAIGFLCFLMKFPLMGIRFTVVVVVFISFCVGIGVYSSLEYFTLLLAVRR